MRTYSRCLYVTFAVLLNMLRYKGDTKQAYCFVRMYVYRLLAEVRSFEFCHLSCVMSVVLIIKVAAIIVMS